MDEPVDEKELAAIAVEDEAFIWRDRIIHRIGRRALQKQYVAGIGNPSLASKAIVEACLYVAATTAVWRLEGDTGSDVLTDRLVKAARDAMKAEFRRYLDEVAASG